MELPPSRIMAGRVEASGEGDNVICIKACFLYPPCRSEGNDVRRQLQKADSVGFHKRRVIKLLGDDDVHDGQRDGGVRPRPYQQDFIRLSLRFRSPHINCDDLGAPPASRDDVAG